jgi:hypothetical protein
MCSGLILGLVQAPWLEAKGEAYEASEVELLGVGVDEAVVRLVEEGTRTLRWVWGKTGVVGLCLVS